MADTHLGAFRDPVLRQLNLEAFLRALEVVREEGCQFLVIAGDLFDTNLPDMDVVDRAAEGLHDLTEAGVRVYVLYGSHDRSLTEKGIVDVLESAGLFTNVGVHDPEDLSSGEARPTVDEPTGVVLAAVGGRRLSLERALFGAVDWGPLEASVRDAPLAIFGYHGPVEGMMPEELAMVEALDRGHLPRGFGYYALGHVHHHTVQGFPGGGIAVYPGTTFGGGFSDLADGREKGLVVVDAEVGGGCRVRFVPLGTARIEGLDVDVGGMAGEEAREELEARVASAEPSDSIVLLRVHGTLSYGRPSDLGINAAREDLLGRGATAVFVNRRGLRKAQAISVEGVRGAPGADRSGIEDRALREALAGQATPVPWLRGEEGLALARDLLAVAKEERGEMSVARYQERVKARAMEVLSLHQRPGPVDEGGDEG